MAGPGAAVLTLLYSLAMACNVAAVGDTFPWGCALGHAGAGEHSHGGAAGDLCCLPGKARKRSELDKMEIDDL